MRPLTIDELRALKAGDWVWLIDIEKQSGYYRQVTINDNNEKIVFYGEFTNGYCPFETYGKKWIAYKNKEQAECKGSIVELPCNVGDTVYWVSCFGQLKVKEFTVVSIDAKTIDGELCWYAWAKNGQGGRCVDNGNSGWYLGLNKARAEEVLRFVKGDDNKWTIK